MIIFAVATFGVDKVSNSGTYKIQRLIHKLCLNFIFSAYRIINFYDIIDNLKYLKVETDHNIMNYFNCMSPGRKAVSCQHRTVINNFMKTK